MIVFGTDLSMDSRTAYTDSVYVTKLLSRLNLPDPEDFSVKFEYNFWTSDEHTNNSGVEILDPISGLPIEGLTSVSSATRFSYDRTSSEHHKQLYYETQSSRFPRIARITLSAITLDSPTPSETNIQYIIANLDSLARSAASEGSMSSGIHFVGVQLQDYEALDDIQQTLSVSFSAVTSEIGGNVIKTNFGTGLFTAMSFAQDGDITVDPRSITIGTIVADYAGSSWESYQTQGYTTYTDGIVEGSVDVVDRFHNVRDVRMNASINTKLLYTALKTAAGSAGCSLSNNLSSAIDDAKAYSNSASKGLSPATTAGDFENVLNPCIVSTSDEGETITSTFQPFTSDADLETAFNGAPMEVVGYLLDKYEISSGGSTTRTQIVVPGNGGQIADSAIAYGKAYKYNARAIVYGEFNSINHSTLSGGIDDQFVRIGALMLSGPTASGHILAVDTVPPPCPVNLDFIFNYDNDTLMITWELPSNPQLDIKKFQVFRRKTTDEPFALQAMYDWDTSLIKSPISEKSIYNSLYHTSSRAVTYYTDGDFNKDTKYIYSIASIDARNMTSGYSSQFEVSFNRYKNGLVVKYISQKGAPKPYPNIYLNEDLFQDTMKTSNYENIHVFFDPEYLNLGTEVEDLWEDAGLISVDTSKESPTYHMQILNLDMQQNRTVDITIDDREHAILGDLK